MRPRRRPASERGQALPLALGAALLLAFAALALAAIGGGATGKARAQRVADLAALSGARSMRDDFGRLFAPARLPDGRPNPRHLPKSAYLVRAADAAVEAAERNGAHPDRIRVEFPDVRSFAPLRVGVELTAHFEPEAQATRADRDRRGGVDRLWSRPQSRRRAHRRAAQAAGARHPRTRPVAVTPARWSTGKAT